MAVVCLFSAVQSGRLAVSHAASVRSERDFELSGHPAVEQYLHRVAVLETNGQLERAERELLRAAEQDRQFPTVWALAQFYHRQGRSVECRRWLRQAAAMSSGDRTAVLRMMSEEFGPSYPEELSARLRSEYEAHARTQK